ncbi:maleylpyruvate isomerase N-terminal domain-containing protein [Pedococcus sp. KACC 23699]|uniref:Maleylpyruvate isomerase N-terminal domain-containing protein n=1 Tax=Pedococcus sp. KACC 23699 TaxID=3149228 RepID=A0AAU7JRW4_9MICO
MDDAAVLTALRRTTNAMAQTVGGLEATLPVPTCPGWDLTALVDHLGRVHLWAEAAVRTGASPEPYPRRDRTQDLASWYAASAGLLLDTLGGRGPHDAAWSFSAVPGHGTVRFWRRRQLHETTIHHVDALAAGGVLDLTGVVEAVPGLSTEQAVDGVGEVFEVFVPRMLARRADDPPEVVVPAGSPVAFACTDTEAAWTLSLVDGIPLVRQGVMDDAVAVVRGPSAHLYLALWHRADTGALGVEGDDRVAWRLLDASLVP